jgi:hypothetical protein
VCVFNGKKSKSHIIAGMISMVIQNVSCSVLGTHNKSSLWSVSFQYCSLPVDFGTHTTFPFSCICFSTRCNILFKNLFINSRLVPVGSFSEGTKAICPDEFDFMFMFFVGQLTIDRGCGPDRLTLPLELRISTLLEIWILSRSHVFDQNHI